jgi:hypothetical protein
MLDSSMNLITLLASGLGGDKDVDVEVNNGRGGQEQRLGDMELAVGVSAARERGRRRSSSPLAGPACQPNTETVCWPGFYRAGELGQLGWATAR